LSIIINGLDPEDIDRYLSEEALKRQIQIFPAFSDGLLESYRPSKAAAHTNIRDITERMLVCATSGQISHWLFSNSFYRAELESTKPDNNEMSTVPDDGLYLDFLVRGDRAGLSPHPLFSNYTYRKRNPDIDFKQDAPFRHYINTGCFEGRATSTIFDQDFYLASNRSARSALSDGTHVSALHHFLTVGLRQDLPFCPDLDVGFYLQRYPDIASAVRSAAMPSASWHFVYHGLGSGRSPNPYFDSGYYRQRHPHVVEERRNLGIRSDLEHFLLIGKDRGYKASKPLTAAPPPMEAAKAVFQRRCRRSLNNIKRSPLVFPSSPSSKPAISVIVPVFNEIEFTSRFLECAYFAAVHFSHLIGKPIEIIIVDNGSTDGTGELIQSCPGLRAVQFDKPIGFPRAVNAGVAASSADMIVVANNDIEFEADTFVKVWRRLSENKDIGMLGGLTILPNETLQEAGSFLNSQGGVMGLGRHENPWDQYFQGLHTADYCTGSFIAFRRTDFDALGGLDEGFSPGYYEETDFAFRMMAASGQRAAVDSDIQVTHFEHASFGKGRPPTTAYALIKRNQARFVNRHRASLARRPSPASLGGVHGVTPSAIKRSRILFIEDLIPDPKLGSGFVRSSQILASLTARGVAYDLLALNANLIVDDFNDSRVHVYRSWMPGEDVETILSTKAAIYSHIIVCRTHNLGRFAHLLDAARQQYGIQIICDTEALSSLRRLEVKRLAGQDVTEAQEIEAVRLELDAPVEVSQWVAVSPHEKEQIEAAGLGPVSVFCHRFEAVTLSATPGWSERTRITAVGAVHDPGSPNHDGMIWLMNSIYPKCPDVFSELTLTVVGFWRADTLESFKKQYPAAKIDFVGPVSDGELRDLYSESRMAIAPTRFAAGVASKVLEAMSLGVPVVMTDLLERQVVGSALAGHAGLAVGLRTDDGASFAHWLGVLARDQTSWEGVRASQAVAVEPLGGAAAFEEGIETLLRRAGIY